MGDITCTIAIYHGDLHKTVSAADYLTPDHGKTYPSMSFPLSQPYQGLRNHMEYGTEEVAHEHIKDADGLEAVVE